VAPQPASLRRDPDRRPAAGLAALRL